MNVTVLVQDMRESTAIRVSFFNSFKFHRLYARMCSTPIFNGKTPFSILNFPFIFPESPTIFLHSNMDFISRLFNSIQIIRSNMVQVRFKTIQKDGILLTIGKANDFFTLELYNGYIRVETNAGGGEMTQRFLGTIDRGSGNRATMKVRLGEC